MRTGEFTPAHTSAFSFPVLKMVDNFLHFQCFNMVGDYEEDIEEWYFHHQDHDLKDFLCQQRILKHAEVDSGLYRFVCQISYFQPRCEHGDELYFGRARITRSEILNGSFQSMNILRDTRIYCHSCA